MTYEPDSARLRPILNLRGLKLPQKRLYLRALDLYATSAFLDFGDAVIVAHMKDQGLRDLYSYDSHFDRIPSVQRCEP